MKVLMVCLGNICRSPLAEGILRQKVKDRGLDWEIDSAGTGSWHIGEHPDPRSIDAAAGHGINISDQRARQIRKTDLQRYDLVLAMDKENFRDIQRLSREEEDRKKVKMIMEFVHPGEFKAVPDPYWDDDGFEQVYHMLDKACDELINHYGPA